MKEKKIKTSCIAPQWWDYTCLDDKILNDAAKLTEKDILQLKRPGFTVRFYETREEFFLAEALEYIEAWQKSTPERPAGICGPIGPTEQPPLVAHLVNSLNISLANCHFWGMDEWLLDSGVEASEKFPLGFAKADWDLCFSRINPKLRPPKDNMHFPSVKGLEAYRKSYDTFRCVIMQGGQGETKHWAFNDPLSKSGQFEKTPPTADDFLALPSRAVNLHPLTIIQNARTSGGGRLNTVPRRALTVGPTETWKAETVSIWHPGWHDNPLGIRLSAFMISKKIASPLVPMSLLARHRDVRFSYLRPGIGTCQVEMH